MIVGIGSDLCDIERVETTLARFGERFIARCFTETEQRRSDRRAGRAASYAKRFAAKEACAKALGTGLRRGVFWRDMGVVNLPSGQPTMRLTGGAAERLKAILPPGTEPFIHLTITDEQGFAQAFVVIEARAAGRRGGADKANAGPCGPELSSPRHQAITVFIGCGGLIGAGRPTHFLRRRLFHGNRKLSISAPSHVIFQAKPYFAKSQQNPAKPEQNNRRKKAWNSFDFLGPIGPFQWVAATLRGQNFFPAPSRRMGSADRDASLTVQVTGTMDSHFC